MKARFLSALVLLVATGLRTDPPGAVERFVANGGAGRATTCSSGPWAASGL
jgi:hypothetical protein